MAALKPGTVNKFPYQPLEDDSTIRVLILHRADDLSAPLLCSLDHQPRADSTKQHYSSPNYTAISYVWGPAIFTRQVLLHGRPFAVTPTVEILLRDLRKPHKDRRLWIDAICLNQADEQEKQQQIPRMGAIYAEARKVLIWLDSPTNGQRNETLSVIRSLRFRERKSLADREQGLIDGLLQHAWWKRRFTLQEGLANPRTYLRYGGDGIDWRSLGTALEAKNVAGWTRYDGTASLLKSRRPFPSRTLYPVEQVMIKGDELEQHFKTIFDGYEDAAKRDENQAMPRLSNDFATPKMDILDALWIHHKTGCADPRDRIAALLGLVQDDLSPPAGELSDPPANSLFRQGHVWRPQYERDWMHNYKTFTKFCLEKGRAETLTEHLIAFGSLNETDSNSPAWVPNWSVARPCNLIDRLHLPDPESIKYLDEYPDVRSSLSQHFSPLTVSADLRSFHIAHIMFVRAPLGELDDTTDAVMEALFGLVEDIEKMYSHDRIKLFGRLASALSGPRRDELWDHRNIYPFHKTNAEVALFWKINDWQQKSKSSPVSASSDLNADVEEASVKRFMEWEPDIAQQAVFNEVTIPLVRERLQSWHIFGTLDGSIGCVAVEPQIGDSVLLDHILSSDEWGYLVRHEHREMLPLSTDHVAYAPCTYGAQSDEWYAKPKTFSDQFGKEKIIVDHGSLGSIQKGWQDSNPWNT